MNILHAAWRSLGVVTLLLVAACDEGRAQECPPALAVQRVELWGLTTDRPAQRRRVEQLQLPRTSWRDSLWVEAVVANRGQRPISAVGVYAAARGVVGPVLFVEELGMSFADHERSLAQGVSFPSPVFFQDLLEGVPSGETIVTLGPFRMQDVFPWLDQARTWHALIVGVDIEVKAMVFQASSGEQCFDDLANNAASTRVPLLNLP